MKKINVNNYKIDKENKTYTYTGQTYTIVNSDNEIKNTKIYFIIILLINIFVLIYMGFRYSKLSNSIFYTLPFVLQLFPNALIISDIYYMFKFNNKLTVEQYTKSYSQFNHATKSLMFFSVLTILGIAYIAISRKDFHSYLIELFMEIIILFSSMISNSFFKKLKFTIKNESFTAKL